MSDEVLVERHGAVQVITINRPEARNALNRAVAVGIRDAVARRTGAGRPFGPAECLTPAQAVELYTRKAAFAMHREHEIGTLEPGKLADLTVLDGNPLTGDLADLNVVATVCGGTATFGSIS